MPTPRHHLSASHSKLCEKAKVRADGAQREVDRVLQLAAQPPPVSLKNAYRYSRGFITVVLLSPEIHLAAIVILIISLGTSIFVPLAAADFSTRVVLVGLAMVFGSTLSVAILYLILPLHLMLNISLWSVAVIHSLLAAAVFSLAEPTVSGAITAYPMPSYMEVFIPFFLLGILADDFILWHLKDRVCLRAYKRRHKADTIETLLPSEKRGEVWLISAADHYVEITTRNGTHMHRMTMKAAVEKAGPSKGLRVHRSHWVAFAAMMSLEKDGERTMLTLRNGQRVPVSQQTVAKVACFLDIDCQDDTP